MVDEVVFNNPRESFKDFLTEGKTTTYEFKTIPSTNFRIEA